MCFLSVVCVFSGLFRRLVAGICTGLLHGYGARVGVLDEDGSIHLKVFDSGIRLNMIGWTTPL